MYGGTTGNTISGNVVAGNLYGVAADGVGTSGNLIFDNLIGVTAATGGTVLANSVGILLQAGSTANTIGGTSLAAANVISGNTDNGVNIGNTGESSNVVAYNYIGSDSANDTGLGNSTGILFFGDTNGGPTNNTIGPGNVISGNTYTGLGIYDTGTSDNVISGNLIGTNNLGTAALANKNGVIIGASATANTIGGSTAAERNVISGNTNYGVEITDTGTDANVVAGNLIGTNLAGSSAVANANSGVEIQNGAVDNTVGGPVRGVPQPDLRQRGRRCGLRLNGTGGNVAAFDWIGLNSAGTAAIANLAGIALIDASGSNPAIDDVISGNSAYGIYINQYSSVFGSSTISCKGTTSAPIRPERARSPITVRESTSQAGSAFNTIGGITAMPRTGDGNLISQRQGDSVELNGAGIANIIEGNLIGTNAAGNAALGNDYGVIFASGSQNTIGGAAAGAGNVISGNVHSGIADSDQHDLIAGQSDRGGVERRYSTRQRRRRRRSLFGVQHGGGNSRARAT